MVQAAIFVIFPFCMMFAALSDLLSMTIANRISITLIIAFAILAPLTGMDWYAFGWHFAAFAMVLGVTFALFALGGMGGGDAKLLASTALWIGFDANLVVYLLYAAIIGGGLAILMLVLRGRSFDIVYGRNVFLKNIVNTEQGVPYGIALGIAAVIVYPATPLMQWAIKASF
ncbi:A24 family peptidase [Limoniibacter endophyticus]|uniref:Peptidase n=1 Tax=Limoniibacter endophyticus TaxID=1565040 RepID=A0A8J3DLA6_9HYPH|nr:prepilin peptidase [Limoniibacter endophyticus]GHC67135.1 peptidase [Limoniibacter endophyticus]